MKYDEFLNSKCLIDSPSGFDWTGPLENGGSCELFPFQKAIVLWALKRGRAAVFADTGLGKTFIEAAWSWVVHQYSGNRVLIFAPLCVAQQTIIEADKIGVPIKYVREMPTETGIFITNYELIDHFEFLIKELFRTLKPGRNISLHLMNLPTSKTHHGYIGIQDFRGRVIASFLKEKFIYHSEVCVWKDPVVAMQRTKALGLLWRQIKKDSSMSRQGIPDYVVIFRKPGENPNPISHTPEEFPVALWQELASPCWNDIKQSNTLNRKLAREESDERHIAPLQLDLIERCLFLWSKTGDIVFSPFAGIGSEGYVAVRMGRKFIGSELKESYFTIAKNNLENLSDDGYIFPEFNKAIGKWTKDQPERSFVQQENDPSQITIFERIGMQ